MSGGREVGRLHVITDVTVQSRYDHVQLATLACRGGAATIQLRDKSLAAGEFLAVARRVREVCTRHGALFIVNDRVREARAAGADGVHVGGDDTSIAEARSILGAGVIIGASAATPADALAAERAGADYVGVGHVYPTTSKHKPGPPIGLDGIRAVRDVVTIPVIAIGGITAERVPDVMRAGASGVAVIAAVCAAPDPEAATRGLVAAMP